MSLVEGPSMAMARSAQQPSPMSPAEWVAKIKPVKLVASPKPLTPKHSVKGFPDTDDHEPGTISSEDCT